MNLHKFDTLVGSVLFDSVSSFSSITEALRTGVHVSLFQMGSEDKEPCTRAMQLSDAIDTLIGTGMVHIQRHPASKHVDTPILDSRNCLVVLSCENGQLSEATIHPAPSADLKHRFLEWLGEPMPETWLFGCAQDSSHWKFDRIIPPDPIPVREVRESAYGLFELALPFRTVPCVTAWQICPAGTTRFDLLLRTEELMSHPLNPYTSALFRNNDIVPVIFHFRHERYDSTIDASVIPTRTGTVADTLALLATMLGYTGLTASDLVALTASWGVAAASTLHEMVPDTAFRTSPLLLTHTMSAIRDPERKLVLELLSKTATHRFTRLSVRYDIDVTTRLRAMDTEFPALYVADHMFSYRDVFNTWMVVRAQLGLPVVSFERLDYKRYLQLVEHTL